MFFFFFFSSRRRHTRCREVSWARRCVQETGTWAKLQLQARNYLNWQNLFLLITNVLLEQRFLPSCQALQPWNLEKEQKKEKGITLSNLSEDEKLLLAQLKDEKYLPIKELKTNLKKIKNFYNLLEVLEAKELIKIKRNFETKLKKKQENYIFLKKADENIIKELTKKQKQFWDFFCSKKFCSPQSLRYSQRFQLQYPQGFDKQRFN
eukprot:TRINITY_DN44605_c0_g1_i3.p1 TRINITY_DN44605_c0_g1~~TRINITY_DN44605_c0_g1_i3.p1  ORF type:complete len:207 (-),score=52.75 TRINITY_DN44605_c0_g1_i3:409-1029(-)